jgi:ATP-dependent RNA helicase DHX57
MPKNAHPPRGSSSKKAAPVAPAEDTSYIVFGDGPKKRKPEPKPDADGQPDAPKPPDIKKLIGGASWTGKLPANLLSEHFQKQKWAKPDYKMVRDTL